MSRIIKITLFWIALFVLFTTTIISKEAKQKKKAYRVKKPFVVVVTATKNSIGLDTVPANVNIINKKQIESNKISSVQDALMIIPGIFINKTPGSWGDNGKISIYGLSPKHTLVLVDGMRIMGGHQGAVDLEQIPVDSVERIEVLKGPSSALYGSDALGGVINIITKSSPSEFKATGKLSYGTRNTHFHSCSFGLGNQKLGFLVDYSFKKSNGIYKETDSFSENQLHTNLKYNSNRIKLNLTSLLSFHNMDFEKRKQQRFGINSNVEYNINDTTFLNLRASLFNYTHSTFNQFSPYYVNWDTHSKELEINFRKVLSSKNFMTFGYQYWNKKRIDNGKNYNASQEIHSLYFQDEFYLKNLSLIIGTRVDSHNDWGKRFNPRIGFSYKIFNDFKIKLSIGKAFRAPSLTKLYAPSWRMGRFYIHGNRELKPESSVGYQIGTEFSKNNFSIKTTLFRNNLENLITYKLIKRTDSRFFDMFWLNIGKALTQGVEVDIKFSFNKDSFFKFGYTRLFSKDLIKNLPLPYKPDNKFDLLLKSKIPIIKLNTSIEFSSIGKRVKYRRIGKEERTVHLSGYTNINFLLSKNLAKSINLFLRINNLTGVKNIEDDYSLQGTEFIGGLKLYL